MRLAAVVVIALGAVAAQPGRASACHHWYCDLSSDSGSSGGGGGAGVVVLLGSILVLDASLTVHDVVVDRSERIYGAAEVLVTSPQVVAGLAVAGIGLIDGSVGETSVGLVYAAWMGVLAVHGAYSLLRPPSERRVAGFAATASGQLAFVPTLVSDGSSLGLGVGVVGVSW